MVSYPDGRITFMEINPNSEAMSTMEARQAVIYALDLDALVYGTYGDEALCRTATSILSTVSMFYNPEITNYKQDLDKAAQLIEQTGLKDKTIKIIYNSARVGQEELATMIKSQLDAVGLNAQIDSMETAAYFKSYFYATDSYDIAVCWTIPAASWVCSPTPAPAPICTPPTRWITCGHSWIVRWIPLSVRTS